MKIGDLVVHAPKHLEHGQLVGTRVGLVVDLIKKKVWRSSIHGKKVDWSKIEPEPHAVVLYSHNNGTINIPTVELRVMQ